MRNFVSVGVVAITVAALAVLAADGKTGPARATLTAEQVLESHPQPIRTQVERDGIAILDGASSDGYVRALVRFQQPKSRTLRLLAQTGRHAEFRPELKSIESHGWSEETALDTHRMKIMFMNIDYRLRTHFDWKAGHIRWELDPSYDNGLEVVEGYWEFYELSDSQTLARFGTKVSVGPNLPEWLEETATRNNIPAAMENARRWVDSDGKYRP